MEIDFSLRTLKEDSLELMHIQGNIAAIKDEVELVRHEWNVIGEQLREEALEEKADTLGLSAFIDAVTGNFDQSEIERMLRSICLKGSRDTLLTQMKMLEEQLVSLEKKQLERLPRLDSYRQRLLEIQAVKSNTEQETYIVAYEEMERRRSELIEKLRALELALEAGEEVLITVIKAIRAVEVILPRDGGFPVDACLDEAKAQMDALAFFIRHYFTQIQELHEETLIKCDAMEGVLSALQQWFVNLIYCANKDEFGKQTIEYLIQCSDDVQRLLDNMDIIKGNVENELISLDAEIDHLMDGYGLL